MGVQDIHNISDDSNHLLDVKIKFVQPVEAHHVFVETCKVIFDEILTQVVLALCLSPEPRNQDQCPGGLCFFGQISDDPVLPYMALRDQTDLIINRVVLRQRVVIRAHEIIPTKHIEIPIKPI
jgi:hypothetical protein